MRKIKFNKWFFLFVISLFTFTLLAFLPKDWVIFSEEYSNNFGIRTIHIVNPILYSSIFWISTIVTVLLLYLTILSRWKKQIPYRVIFIFLAIVGYPVSCSMSFLSNLAPWTCHGVINNNENTFYFLDSSFLQGQTMTIAKLNKQNIFFDSFDVLVTNNGDSPRSYASIIRPKGAKNMYGQLYLTSSNLLVGVRYDNMCFLAYDLPTNKKYGHGEIEKISPFVLIDHDSVLFKEDIELLINNIKKIAKYCIEANDIRITDSYLSEKPLPGSPNKKTIEKGLTHPNIEVRTLARRLLVIYNKGQKKALTKIHNYVDKLIFELKDGDSKTKMRVLETLGNISYSGAKKAIPYIVREVKNNELDIGIMAAQTLGCLGNESVPFLIKLLNDNEVSVRRRAIFGLGTFIRHHEMETNKTRIINALKGRLNDSDKYVYTRAKDLLKEFDQNRHKHSKIF